MKIKDIKDKDIRNKAILNFILDEDNVGKEVNIMYIEECELTMAFSWRRTPEGGEFWHKVNQGLGPYAKDEVCESTVKNFTGLTKYPVGTKVKTTWGEGTIVDIRDGYTHCIGVNFGGSLTDYLRPYDNAEVIVDNIDLSICKEGDRLLLQNGEVVFYKKKHGTLDDIHCLITEPNGVLLLRRTNGRFYNLKVSEYDVIQILPPVEDSAGEPAQEPKSKQLYCTLVMKGGIKTIYSQPICAGPYADESGFLVILPDNERNEIIRVAISEVESYQTWKE